VAILDSTNATPLYAWTLGRSVNAMKFTDVSRAIACSLVSIPGVA
jgi:hypothetical protein